MKVETFGDATLYLGDCLDIMPTISKVDAVITDPPYGITHCEWDIIIPFTEMWAKCNRVIKPNGAICVFGVEPFSSTLRLSNLSMYRYDWIYEKTEAKGHLNSKKRPLSAHENISVFYSAQPTYNPQKTTGHERKISNKKPRSKELGGLYGAQSTQTHYDSTERYPRSVLKFRTDKQIEHYHPTQKPVALIEYLVRIYTHEGETVMDFSMGSGTTGVAALHLDRKFIGIEKEPKYFDIACKRIDAESRKMKLL